MCEAEGCRYESCRAQSTYCILILNIFIQNLLCENNFHRKRMRVCRRPSVYYRRRALYKTYLSAWSRQTRGRKKAGSMWVLPCATEIRPPRYEKTMRSNTSLPDALPHGKRKLPNPVPTLLRTYTEAKDHNASSARSMRN